MPFQRYSKPYRSFSKKPSGGFNKQPFKKPFKKRFAPRKLRGTTDRPRLVVFRSLKHLYGQLVDDDTKKTITTVSTHSKELREQMQGLTDRVQAARIVGKAMATKLLAMNIKGVVFDRNGFVYHGRVKAFAEGAREAGLWLHSH
jgi:large subunit ribosomal protein L18